MSSKTTILTGIRVNNDLHIGNYLGAISPMIDLATQQADDYQINLFVPDLHSFTTPIDHSKLQDAIINTVSTYVALGLPINHENVHVYRQSFIPAHSELALILGNFTSFGEMFRMTQFKDKGRSIAAEQLHRGTELTVVHDSEQPGDASVRKADENVSVGLFNYPILMAADILLYDARYVPVGDDQTQHLEFTRDIAERMNNKFNQELFVIPEPVQAQHKFFGKDQGLRIRDLAYPSKKMSKSHDSSKGLIFLSDSPEIARKKIMSATTDNFESIQYDYNNRPGVSNLLDLYTLFGGSMDEFIGQTKYGPLKSAVSEKIATFLEEHQQLRSRVEKDEVESFLRCSEQAMEKVANTRLHDVQRAIGIRP